MNFLRLHWFDVGFFLAILTGAGLFWFNPSPLSWILWANLIALFFHQLEEYRYPGYFPGMMNTVMFSSQQPDRYPLNANTALIINLGVGWLAYFLAAVFGERAIWLGIAAILVSVGNIFAHTFLFNLKGKTFYNPGMVTALLLFAPITAYFGFILLRGNFATLADWVGGILLGVVLNFIGVVKSHKVVYLNLNKSLKKSYHITAKQKRKQDRYDEPKRTNNHIGRTSDYRRTDERWAK